MSRSSRPFKPFIAIPPECLAYWYTLKIYLIFTHFKALLIVNVNLTIIANIQTDCPIIMCHICQFIPSLPKASIPETRAMAVTGQQKIMPGRIEG